MNFKSKTFSDLTTRELYEILRARETVFLLEQRIVCEDMDRADYHALHCFLEEEGELVAYLRAYATDKGAKLGRVLTLKRSQGYGARLMNEALPAIQRHISSISTPKSTPRAFTRSSASLPYRKNLWRRAFPTWRWSIFPKTNIQE